MAKHIRIVVDHGAMDVTLDHCLKHDEWYSDGCQRCTVDEMEVEKQERYEEGYEAGKVVGND